MSLKNEPAITWTRSPTTNAIKIEIWLPNSWIEQHPEYENDMAGLLFALAQQMLETRDKARKQS